MALIVIRISTQGMLSISSSTCEHNMFSKYTCSDFCVYVFGPRDSIKLKKGFDSEGHAARLVIEQTRQLAYATIAKNGNSVVLQRGKCGQRTLFYAQLPGAFLVADSFIEIIHAVGQDSNLRPNTDGIRQFIFHRLMLPPLTIVEGIFEVYPGAKVTYSGGCITIDREPIGFVANPRPIPEMIRDLMDTLDHSVSQAVEQGFGRFSYLSGGLDSAIACGLARKYCGVTAITLGFRDGRLDETANARTTARHLGIPHRTIVARPLDVLEIESIIGTLDRPYGYPAYLASPPDCGGSE